MILIDIPIHVPLNPIKAPGSSHGSHEIFIRPVASLTFFTSGTFAGLASCKASIFSSGGHRFQYPNGSNEPRKTSQLWHYNGYSVSLADISISMTLLVDIVDIVSGYI